MPAGFHYGGRARLGCPSPNRRRRPAGSQIWDELQHGRRGFLSGQPSQVLLIAGALPRLDSEEGRGSRPPWRHRLAELDIGSTSLPPLCICSRLLTATTICLLLNILEK